VAAPEIVRQAGTWFIAALNPNLDGIRLSFAWNRTSAIKPVIPVSSNEIGGQGRPTGRDDLPQRYGCIDRRL